MAWALPAAVGACMSTRSGGVSTGPFSSLNLGDHVGDDAADVAENRRRWHSSMGADPCWLRQIHGTAVVDAAALRGRPAAQADASWSTVPGVACVVLVADCLPLLMAAPNGRAVAAAHAGWRGLAGGVIENTLDALTRAAGCSSAEIDVWIGPGIGPRRFEVGADVVAAFGPACSARFVASARADGTPRWLADLPGLARDRLERCGVHRVSGGTWCTFEDDSRFFSFRRDGLTGRMAAAIWIG